MNGAGALRRRVRAWLRRHSYSFFSSLGALLHHRTGTLMTVLVLGIGILLPLGLYVMLDNLDQLDLKREDWSSVTVFMLPGATEAQVAGVAQSLASRNDVADVQSVSPQQGMAEFSESSGFGPSLEMLGTNPLPWVLMVRPAGPGLVSTEFEAQVAGLVAHLESVNGVDSVQFDHKWLQRLGRMLDLGKAAVTVLSLVFGLAVIVVVANTIRLDVAARSEEIEILALVGAGNAFIRQPFLYSGLWYGLMGGLLAAGLVQLCLFYLARPLGRLLDAYGRDMSLSGLDITQTSVLLLVSAALGLLGAWIAVQRYLRILAVGGTLGRR
ncbi:MAG: ABC transporter permease [Xanthomonadales bacterium]|nr:permease-like cell division protein FtsX [Gammaproteobacteria bacterium]NNE05860.1 ABC transporter permease [Xanthomonadales bacterium]NNL94578.1 ABC transporter permease [Xanthomonadales bacterium]